MFIPNPDLDFLAIPDPGSGSATLVLCSPFHVISLHPLNLEIAERGRQLLCGQSYHSVPLQEGKIVTRRDPDQANFKPVPRWSKPQLSFNFIEIKSERYVGGGIIG
jgi:hypothetical protein